MEIILFTSKLMQIKCGEPQGSILGPKVILLYVNDIFNVSSDITYMLYADDTSILCSNNDGKQLCSTKNKMLTNY